MTVGRSRDGVPSWDGEPSTWTEYRRAALLFVESTKWSNRYLCGPRLATELSGPAKASIAGKKPTWLSREDGMQRLLTHLQTAISEPVPPEVGNALRAYFKTLRRRRGETMTSFCVRHREEYEKACRALTRMMASQQPQPDLRKSSSSKPTSRRSSWREVAPQTLGPELRNSTPSVTTPQNGSQGATQEATASANQRAWMAATDLARPTSPRTPGRHGTTTTAMEHGARQEAAHGANGGLKDGINIGTRASGELGTPSLRTKRTLWRSFQMSSKGGCSWRKLAWTR